MATIIVRCVRREARLAEKTKLHTTLVGTIALVLPGIGVYLLGTVYEFLSHAPFLNIVSERSSC